MYSLRQVYSIGGRVSTRTLARQQPIVVRALHAATSLRDEKKDEPKPVEPEATEDNKLEAELAACKEEAAKLATNVKDINDKYMRALAEMENVRKRARTDVDNQKHFAIQKFSKSLIEVADIFTLATQAIKEEELASDPKLQNMHKGLTMTQDALHKAFKDHGLEKFEPLGEVFDPNAHEAVFELPDPSKEPGTVGVVQQAGYLLNSRTLRAAKVGVVRKQD
ncbi:co-chaperone GrpE [Sphaeroforma arctica JP610]|uniref:GrpE protein homolog n=1 Tax=Sphaeroforma arctica JP610 TaxID=667725 RepID=A0A0L0FPK0_9EUKA|nr:co-chaperone GrpE [Sphaeroforma arctica JP610]KNC78634.1 co-chaperone GrpE [Sphaeroforma arctica JP610]|eukprot:XP_014152536.1 co-chaperone GrpE [Sphaeroforma arctica JP610]